MATHVQISQNTSQPQLIAKSDGKRSIICHRKKSCQVSEERDLVMCEKKKEKDIFTFVCHHCYKVSTSNPPRL